MLIVVVSLTTPIFLTSRNLGNVLSQTAVIAVLALGQLLVIVSRGIDLSVGSTVALSGVVGAIVYVHVHSTVLVVARDPRHGASPSGSRTALVFVLGRMPHPFIVTLASLSIVRGIALWAANGTLISGHAGRRSTRSAAASIGWLPYSTFVVVGLALLAVVRHDLPRLGPLAVRGRRQSRAARRAGIPVGRVLDQRLRAERPRRRRRRPAHRGPDRRRARRRPATSPSSTRSPP